MSTNRRAENGGPANASRSTSKARNRPQVSDTFRMTKVQARALEELREAPQAVGALFGKAEATLPVGLALAQWPGRDLQRMYEPRQVSSAAL